MQSLANSIRFSHAGNLVPRACDPREGKRGSGIIRCRKPGILAKIELRIPFQRPIRFLPETDYPKASRSFPRIAGSRNEIVMLVKLYGEYRYLLNAVNSFKLVTPIVLFALGFYLLALSEDNLNAISCILYNKTLIYWDLGKAVCSAPSTAVVAEGATTAVSGPQNTLFPSVSVNKW
jgi:hypothetical protein